MIPWIFRMMTVVNLHSMLTKTSGSPLKPVHFEFHHEETIAISSEDDPEDAGDYGDDPESSPHVRKRRDAKWSPDYDLYGQWAEEYYAEYESAQLKAQAKLHKQTALSNRTAEEMRKSQKKKQSLILIGLAIAALIVGICIAICALRILAKRLFFRLFCDFCDVQHFKEKISDSIKDYEPGVHVRKSGEVERYTPTEEELEALREVRKLLYSVY